MRRGQTAEAREAALFLDRFRATIQAEVERRMARSLPPPAARAEIVRRFRSFCRLASIHPEAARPSLDGLAGNSPAGLERAVSIAVDVACECGPKPEIARELRSLERRFRSGLRRVMQPERPEPRRRHGRRRVPNAGKRVRSAIDRIGDAYVALNLDTGTIYDLNPAAETLFALEGEKLLSRALCELVHPADRASFGNLEARLDAGEDAGPLEMGFARPDGERIPVELTVWNHTIAGKRLAIFVAREFGDPLLRKPLRPSAQLYSTRST